MWLGVYNVYNVAYGVVTYETSMSAYCQSMVMAWLWRGGGILLKIINVAIIRAIRLVLAAAY